MLATSQGYCCHIEPYPGYAEAGTDEYDLGSAGNVVFYLAKKLREAKGDDKELSITTDNFFTSIPLLTKLKSDLNIISTGTIRRNRIPSNPVDENALHQRGDMLCYKEAESRIFLTAWKDNKAVMVASSSIGATPVTKVKRFCRREKKKIEIPFPMSIAHYNRTMGGVDLMDQSVSHCRSSIRGKKWYYPIAIALFDITIVNAWHLYRLVTCDTKKINFFEFTSLNILPRRTGVAAARKPRISSASSAKSICIRKTVFSCINHTK